MEVHEMIVSLVGVVGKYNCLRREDTSDHEKLLINKVVDELIKIKVEIDRVHVEVEKVVAHKRVLSDWRKWKKETTDEQMKERV